MRIPGPDRSQAPMSEEQYNHAADEALEGMVEKLEVMVGGGALACGWRCAPTWARGGDARVVVFSGVMRCVRMQFALQMPPTHHSSLPRDYGACTKTCMQAYVEEQDVEGGDVEYSVRLLLLLVMQKRT